MTGKLWAALVLCNFLLLTSCGGGGDGAEVFVVMPSSAPTTTGMLSVSLSDATTTDYHAIYITVREVAVHKDGGGWDIVSTPNKTYNLLELVNGLQESLGLATLSTGHYTQMRLILAATPDDSLNILLQKHAYGNYFIDNSNQIHELTIPSELQSGIKIVKAFDINQNQTTELLLDFDATRSIVEPGSNNKWLLKPTIRLLATTDYAIIDGIAGQEGVLVSAQVYTASVSTPEDQVTIEAATVSDTTGRYKLFVPPGEYTIVGYKDQRSPFYTSAKIMATPGTVFSPPNFILLNALTGSVTGKITISQAAQEQYAVISIRQTVLVNDHPEQIEIKSINVADGGMFTINLPIGSYTAVISTYGKITFVQAFAVSQGVTTNLGSINFP